MSVSETSAMPVGLRSRVPAKMTSSMRAPRSDLADCSPSTHEIASEIFDLPQPLGPTMAAIPSPWNLSSVRSQKDLNPRICSFFSLSKARSFMVEPEQLMSSQVPWGKNHQFEPEIATNRPKVMPKCPRRRARDILLQHPIALTVPTNHLPVKSQGPCIL